MMRLNLNKLIVRRGTIIEVSWDARLMSSVQLIMKNSGKEAVMNVDPVGCKKFRISGDTVRRVISLKAIDSKGISRHVDRIIFVVGKTNETTQYDSYKRISPLKEKMSAYGQTVKNIWNRYPREKRRLYLILVFLMTNLTFATSHPELAKTFTIVAIGYILYLIIKR